MCVVLLRTWKIVSMDRKYTESSHTYKRDVICGLVVQLLGQLFIVLDKM